MSEKPASAADEDREARGARHAEGVTKGQAWHEGRCSYELSGSPGFASSHEAELYTIRELRRGLYRTWAIGFTLIEIVNEIEGDQSSEPFFSADRF
jgi:hypothetical protein